MNNNKKLKSGLFVALLLLVFSSCNKYIDKQPLDEFTTENFWTNENDVRSYCWSFYLMFTGFGTGASGDFYFSSFNDDQAGATFQKYDEVASPTDGNWTTDTIRKANILLENIDKVPMDDSSKNHWRGVAHFFRAFQYFELVKRFGDVPWINHSIDVSDPDLYKPRDPRALVMDSVLADINYAVAHLRAADQANTVVRNVALALKARICLYEGTYRKYHTEKNTTGADLYLQQCQDACSQLMAAGYTLDPDYQTVYNSLDLSGDREVILYRSYVPGLLGHSVIGYTTGTSLMNGINKSAVESYLCSDGLPIGQSLLYKGDTSIAAVRTNRDKRLLETISDFICYDQHLVKGMNSTTGYKPAKFEQPADPNQTAGNNSTDAPIFWLPEVLENYAEASAELADMGKYTLTTADLDKSVNLLRRRAGLADLQVLGVLPAVNGQLVNDPKKDADVSAMIWEMRRDRRAELMMDGFRYDDLMRWKKGWYMDDAKNPDIFLGARVSLSDPAKHNTAGYLSPYPDGLTRPFIDPKNYLYPVPTSQISLYPAGVLTQNPGW